MLYLRESLGNHTDDQIAMQLYQKLKSNRYTDELAFVEDLTDPELTYLNQLLEHEMDYATQANDATRLVQLNGIYEILL